MAKTRAIRALSLETTDRIPCQEWVDHPAFIQKTTGIDPFEQPAEATLAAVRALDIDWVIDIPRQAVKFSESETTVEIEGARFSEWGFTGSIWEDETVFTDVDEVLAYRPLEDTAGRVRVVSREYREGRIAGPRWAREYAGDAALVSGLYYTTLFQFGIMAFGFEHFLMAAALEPETYGVILDQFTEISVQNVTEWVKDDCPVFFCHDDLALTNGLVFPPDWYRKNIFPRYERIFEPARQAGKRIIFVSDGNYMPLIDDLFSLGIDGIMVDPSNDLQWVLDRYGDGHVVIGNVDTLVLTTGGYEDVKREVVRCAELGKRYPGYFFKASGDLPHNIPLENMEAYFALAAEYGRR